MGSYKPGVFSSTAKASLSQSSLLPRFGYFCGLGFGFWIQDFGFWIQGFWFWVWGLGFGALAFKTLGFWIFIVSPVRGKDWGLTVIRVHRDCYRIP